MEFPKVIYHSLESIVGVEYISNDPSICKAYSRGGFGMGLFDRGSISPACVVLPKNTEQIQAIVRLANRYKFPFIPVSTFFIGFCSPLRPNTVIIDPKRMDKCLIDVENMYATVESYVTYSQLQCEAMKHGLFVPSTLAGAQISVLANHIAFGIPVTAHRTGIANRRLMAIEWVLPDGEIVKTGSAISSSDEYFWGEGPGPDLRGLGRGYFSTGGMGFVTKVSVKLFPLPKSYTPEPFGVSPNTTFSLPSDRFRWYILNYPTPEAAVDAMVEIGRAEIGTVCMRVQSLWRDLRRATSKEEYWQLYEKSKIYLEEKRPNIIRVLLVGFASEKQADYEERVLQDIAIETGATMVKRGPDTGAADCFQPSYTNCAYRPGGLFISEKLGFDSMDHALKFLKDGIKIKRKFMPPFVDDKEEAGWILSYDFGHHAHGEMTSYFENTKENIELVLEHERQQLKRDLEIKAYTGMQYGAVHDILGPEMCNYHNLLMEIKKAFDKDDLSNPTRFIQMTKNKEDGDLYYTRMHR